MIPLLRALAQFDDPAFTGVLLRSVGLALLSFVAIGAACAWGVQTLLHASGWTGWLVGLLSTAGTALLALWLFLPTAMLIATLYIERIASAVDRRWYPGLPPPNGAALSIQLWDSLALAGRVLLLNLVAVVLALGIPGVGLFLGWFISGWAFGRGLFVAVAMRRMGLLQARAAYAALRGPVLLQGVLMAFAGSIPGVNLLVPIVGTAVMVHVLNVALMGARHTGVRS